MNREELKLNLYLCYVVLVGKTGADLQFLLICVF